MTIHFLPPNSDRYDAAVEDAIATCNGDLRGAHRALMLVNEQLESELVELQAAMAAFGTVERHAPRPVGNAHSFPQQTREPSTEHIFRPPPQVRKRTQET